MCALTHSDPNMGFFHARLSICASVRAFVRLWSSKVLNLPVCLSTSNGLVETTFICQHPWKCYIKNKKTTKNMALQEDACLVASFIQMNVFCVQNLQTRPQKTALNIKNAWMPKKVSSEVASHRRWKWSWCLVPRLSLPLSIASCKNVVLIYHAWGVIIILEYWPWFSLFLNITHHLLTSLHFTVCSHFAAICSVEDL